MSVASDTFAVKHSNSIVPPAVTTSLLATSVVPAPVVFSSSQQLSSVGVSSSLRQVSSSVVPTPVVFSSNQQLASFSFFGSSYVSSSVVPTPVDFSSSQLSTSVDTSMFHMDIIHKFHYQLVTLRVHLPAYRFYVHWEVPLISHRLKFCRSMVISYRPSVDSQGRKTYRNQEVSLISLNNMKQ